MGFCEAPVKNNETIEEISLDDDVSCSNCSAEAKWIFVAKCCNKSKLHCDTHRKDVEEVIKWYMNWKNRGVQPVLGHGPCGNPDVPPENFYWLPL